MQKWILQVVVLTQPAEFALAYCNSPFLSFNFWRVDPELNVVTKDDEQGSEYQGIFPFSETLLTLKVKIEVAYPSALLYREIVSNLAAILTSEIPVPK